MAARAAFMSILLALARFDNMVPDSSGSWVFSYCKPADTGVWSTVWAARDTGEGGGVISRASATRAWRSLSGNIVFWIV
jgi:hypothetical protein